MSAVTTRVRGMAPWNPRPETMVVVEKAKAILLEYTAYLPLTIRQIFYRLVGAHNFEKTEKAYKRLAEYINRGRRAGLIPFDAIRDDGITTVEPHFWVHPAELLDNFVAEARDFRLDRQEGQPRRLIFAVEAGGMIPQVQRIADPYGITVQSCGGFDSTTAKYDLGVSLGQWPRCEVLHIGDHDPSGAHMFSSIGEDVQAFAHDLGFAGDILFTRLAVTPAQIRQLNLPTAAPKETDKRSFEGLTTQAEAIAPDVLAGIIRAAIESRLHRDAYDAVLAREKATQEALVERLRPLLGWSGAS